MGTVLAADLFCGAGGFSTGLLRAASGLGHSVDLLAVNHWPVAVETHSANHPQAVHYCESIEGVDPRKAVPGGRLHLLMASPECTHHSNARGGKPMSDQSRATAWHVLRWAEALYVDHILIENVKEFQSWGPLDQSGRPVASMKGRLYRQFLASLRALGYSVDARILNAADYGDATTRHRLFIQARRGHRRPSWPAATHVPSDGLGLFPDAKPWRAAREIIDWSLPGKSIYGRKRPLAPNTMSRIYAGLRKYSGLPFLVPNFGEREGQSPRTHGIDTPLPTVTGHGAGALVHPYLVVLRNNCDALPVDGPLGTLTTARNYGLCQPYIVGTGGPAGQGVPQSVDAPLGTVLGRSHRALIEPFLIPVTHSGGPERAHDIGEPLPVVTTAHRGEFALCEPFLAEYHGGADGDRRTRGLDLPFPTLDTSNRFALVQPFLVSYNSTGGPRSLGDPLGTVTTRDRFALISPEMVADGLLDKGQAVALLDIRFRMLQPHELAAAHSFPHDYIFAGNQDDQVRQVGNSVGVGQAEALCREILRKLPAAKGGAA